MKKPRYSLSPFLAAALLGSIFASSLPAQTLKLKFGFEDSGTTTVDTVNAVSLLLSNSAGAIDLHGPAGSGVGGVGKALNLGFNGTHGGTGGAVAETPSSSAINFGTVTAFTMTLWIKPNVTLASNPRFFFVGPSGTADINTAGTMGIQGNQTGSGTSAQTFLGTANNTFNGLPVNMVSNQWSFLAFTYDGTTLSVYNASETNAVGTAVTAARTATMPVGASFRVFLGNNNSLNRSFNGYMDDVRFYTGAANAAFLETVRKSAIPDPYVLPTTISIPIAPLNSSVVLSAFASGTAPLYYSWLFTDTNGVSSILANATNAMLTITNVQFANAGNYSLIVSNNPGGVPTVITNVPATLAVRVPGNPVWIGTASGLWNTTDINWDSNNDGIADTNYFDADNAFFTDAGVAASIVDVESALNPSSVTVSNTLGDYDFTSSGAGSLNGVGLLKKQGTSRLILDVDNNLSGGTLINGGLLQIGGDAITPRGSLGTGNVTNNIGLIISRSGTWTIPGVISGPGGFTNNTFGAISAGNVILSGSNTYSGVTEVNGGTLSLANNNALGNSPLVNVNSTTTGANLGTRVSLSGGISIPAMTTLSLPSTFDTARSALFSIGNAGQTNIWNGPIILNGNGNIAFTGGGGTILAIAGNITGPNFDSSPGGGLQLRAISGLLTGSVNLPTGNVILTDGVLWYIRPPSAGGNTWSNTIIASGTMQSGINNALPTGAPVTFGQSGGSGILDLAGFNQRVGGLAVAAAATGTGQLITNSSLTADSTLTFGSTSPYFFGGAIKDGARKINLTVAGGSLALSSAANAYHGNTTVSGGTLELDFPVLDTNSTVSVNGGASLLLEFTGTNRVNALVLGGVNQPAGVYNSTTSSPLITGLGSLVIGNPVATNPTNILFSVSGTTLALSWPADHLGWILQSQTNTLSTGLGTNWVDVSGSGSVTSTNITINPSNPALFYRLRSP